MKKTFIFLFISLFVLFFNTSVDASGSITLDRIGGTDRFDVANNVAQRGWPSGSDTVVLVNYMAFADALSASPLAYKNNAPVLLTHADTLTPKTENKIKSLNAKKIIIIGGTGSVSEKVDTRLKELNLQTERIGGIDRFEVAYNVSMKLDQKGKVILTNGLIFADALSVSPLASANEFPILLTKKDEIPSFTQKAIDNKKPTQTIIVGGTGSVSDTIQNAVNNPLRVGGKDRYEVAVNIAKTFNLSATKVAISNGETFADALTGSVLATKENMPLLLTRTNSVPDVTKAFVKEKQTNSFVVFGGTGSVSDSVAAELKNEMPLIGKRIVLDAGHGGTDPGAVKNGYYEKNLNMSFVKLLAGHLKNLGAEVIYTRNPSKDVYISLADRALFANKQNADLFISIHHDSSADASMTGQSVHYSSYRPGIETKDVYVKYAGKTYPFIREDTPNKLFYYQDGNTTKSMSYMGDIIAYDTISPSSAAIESSKLAPIASNAVKYNGIAPGYIKDANLYVTRWTTMPSILIELGFISNKNEVSLLSQSKVQNERSLSLAKAIENYYK